MCAQRQQLKELRVKFQRKKKKKKTPRQSAIFTHRFALLSTHRARRTHAKPRNRHFYACRDKIINRICGIAVYRSYGCANLSRFEMTARFGPRVTRGLKNRVVSYHQTVCCNKQTSRMRDAPNYCHAGEFCGIILYDITSVSLRL